MDEFNVGVWFALWGTAALLCFMAAGIIRLAKYLTNPTRVRDYHTRRYLYHESMRKHVDRLPNWTRYESRKFAKHAAKSVYHEGKMAERKSHG